MYVLRDVLLGCDDVDMMEIALEAASFFSDHVHDWEPQYASVGDVKTRLPKF